MSKLDIMDNNAVQRCNMLAALLKNRALLARPTVHFLINFRTRAISNGRLPKLWKILVDEDSRRIPWPEAGINYATLIQTRDSRK